MPTYDELKDLADAHDRFLMKRGLMLDFMNFRRAEASLDSIDLDMAAPKSSAPAGNHEKPERERG